MGWLDSIASTARPYLNAAASGIAANYGINLGSTSPQAQAAPPLQGVPTQAPQPQFAVGAVPWYRKPLVIVVAGVAVALLAWKLLKGK